MTEVQLSRLLSDLSETAAVLNRESDTINSIIERFENALRKLNIGLEVWLSSKTLESNSRVVSGPDEQRIELVEAQLGFAKLRGEWCLGIRQVEYQLDDQVVEAMEVQSYQLLRDASREMRIASLRLFPDLLKAIKEQAEEALKTINDAKKFVDLC
jgi:hypothetical protein